MGGVGGGGENQNNTKNGKIHKKEHTLCDPDMAEQRTDRDILQDVYGCIPGPPIFVAGLLHR